MDNSYRDERGLRKPSTTPDLEFWQVKPDVQRQRDKIALASVQQEADNAAVDPSMPESSRLALLADRDNRISALESGRTTLYKTSGRQQTSRVIPEEDQPETSDDDLLHAAFPGSASRLASGPAARRQLSDDDLLKAAFAGASESGKNEPGLWDRTKAGVRRTFGNAEVSVMSDPKSIAKHVAKSQTDALPQSRDAAAMAEEIKPYVDAVANSEGAHGVWNWAKLIAKRASQFATHHREFAGAVLENLPNSAPGLAGSIAGAMGGGAVAGPVGAFAGSIAGGTAGGTMIERGGALEDQIVQEAVKRGVDPKDPDALVPIIEEKLPEFSAAAWKKGIGTAGTDALLTRLTLGIGSRGSNAIVREAKAIREGLKAGTYTAEQAGAALAKVEARNVARNTLLRQAGRGAGITAGEMGGEMTSEAVGQQWAYGKVNPLEVVDEGVLALGQGGAMAMGSAIANKAMGMGSEDTAESAIEETRGAIGAVTRLNETAPPGPTPPGTTPPSGTTPTDDIALERMAAEKLADSSKLESELQPGDKLRKDGTPFKSADIAGKVAAGQKGDGWTVVPVTGGFVIRQVGAAPASTQAESGAISQGPTGFGQQSELADLIAQESRDVEQSRQAIAEQQGVLRDARTEAADGRVESQRIADTRDGRMAVLEALPVINLADPITAFEQALSRAGYRDSSATNEERALIARRQEASSAFGQDEQLPLSPNEGGDFGIKERKPIQPAPAGDRVRAAKALLTRKGNRIAGDAIRNKDGKVLFKFRPGELEQVLPTQPVTPAGQEAARLKAIIDAKMGANETRQPITAKAGPAFDAKALDLKAHEAATSPKNDIPHPTPAQKDAGNYQKGHVRLHGLDISIENPQGSNRSGVDRSGRAWSVKMQHHYGYIRGTVGLDKDHIDLFMTKDAPTATAAWVVDQIDPKTGKMDEHKVVLGPATEAEARSAYLDNYEKGWGGIGAITRMPLDTLKAWLRDPSQTSRPVAYKPAAPTPAAESPITKGAPNEAEKAGEAAQEVLTPSVAADIEKMKAATQEAAKKSGPTTSEKQPAAEPKTAAGKEAKKLAEQTAQLPAVREQLSVEFGGQRYPVESLQDASEKWEKFRDTTGAGVSDIGNGVPIFDRTGKQVAYVSYNGNVWQGAEYDAKAEPIYSPKGQEQLAAPIQEKAAPATEERSYTKGQAEVLARRMTNQGLPSEAYPHPTEAGMWAIRVPGEEQPADAGADFLASNRAEFRHEGFRIYPISIKGEPRWAVQSLDNSEREKKGERQLGGDAIVDTPEQAKQQAESQVTERSQKAEDQRQFAEQDAAEEAKKEANRGLSITQRRANAALDKPTNLPVNAGVGRGTRREAMESAVSQERAITAVDVRDTAAYKRDEDEQGRLHRAGYGAFFGNDSHPQKMRFNELSAKLKNRDNYQKKEYRLYMGRDTEGSFYDITKTEYDYAQTLIATKKAEASTPAPSTPTAKKEPWQYGELEYGDKYIDEVVLPQLRKDLENAHGGKFQEYKSKAAAVRGLKDRIDTLENHRDAKARKYYASLDDHYAAVRRALAAGKDVPAVAYESYDDLKADVSAGRIKGDGQEVARVEQPQHIEAGQAEPATAPVIAASIKESAKNTPMNIEQARDWLLKQIDAAMIDAKSAAEEDVWDRAEGKVDLKGRMNVKETIGYKVFDVPGDGRFSVLNLKESLQKFKKQVAATPGFKKNATRPMSVANGSGGKTSVRDMLEDGEYVLAVDYGRQIGEPLLFGAVRKGEAHPIAYTNAEPVDIKGIEAQVGREWNVTGKSFSWRVIETTTGVSVSSETTKERAVSKAKAYVDEHGADKLIAQIKETPKVSQAELEKQFTDWGTEEEARQQAKRDAVERVDAEDRALWNALFPLADVETRSPNPWNDLDGKQVAVLAKDAAKAGKGDEFVSLIERRKGGTNNMLALAARKALADAAPKVKPAKGSIATGVASKILGDIYQRAAYNKWTWDRLKSYLTREMEEAGVGKSRMANALEKAMTEYARTANGRLGYPNSNLVFSAMRDYGLIAEDAAAQAKAEPAKGYPFYSNNKLFNAEGTAELPKDWTGVAMSDSGKGFFYLGQDNGERSYNPLKAGTYEDALKEADGLKNDKPVVPEGYREVARGYFGGTIEKPIYAPFAEGERVRFVGGLAGKIESFIGGPVTTGAIIKYDNGLTGRAEWRDVEAVKKPAAEQKPKEAAFDVDAEGGHSWSVIKAHSEWVRLAKNQWHYRFEGMGQGVVIDTHAEEGRSGENKWRTSDGELHVGLAEAKAHEIETHVKPKLIENGYLNEAAPKPATEASQPVATKEPAIGRAPWQMTREEASDQFPGDEYDKMLNRAAVVGDISYDEAHKRSRISSIGRRELWAQTRADLLQEKKDAIKLARGERADINKMKPTKEFAPWRIKSMSATGKAAIESAGKYYDELLAVHKDRVQEAIEDGKDVPAEVLADYPDLATKKRFEYPNPEYTNPSDLPAMRAVVDYMNGDITRDAMTQIIVSSGLQEGTIRSITNRLGEDSYSNGEIADIKRQQAATKEPAQGAEKAGDLIPSEPLPAAIEALPAGNRSLYKVDAAIERAKTGVANRRISDDLNERGTADTPEMAMRELDNLRAIVAEQDGKLRSKNRTGATPGNLLTNWEQLNGAINGINESRRESPEMWAAYDARQAAVAAMNSGDRVLDPYSSLEHPFGQPATIDRKFSKNWRVKFGDGSTALYNPSTLRPMDEKSGAGETAAESAKESRGPRSGGQSREAVALTVSPIVAQWKNAPRLSIVQSVAEAREQNPGLTIHDDAHGFYHAGAVTLIADNLPSKEMTEYVLLHEALGHAGLASLLRGKLDPVLRDIFQTNVKMQLWAAKWLKQDVASENQARIGAGRPIMTKEEERAWRKDRQLLTVEEVLANEAGTGNVRKLKGWDKLVAAVRSWARSLGFTLDWTDNDVVNLLLRTREHIEGKGAAHFFTMNGDEGARFSQQPKFGQVDTESAEIDGVMRPGVDRKGRPLITVNGRPTAFTPYIAKLWAEKYENGGYGKPLPPIPNGWYVHGRADKDNLETGSVIQMTRDWDVAEQYAGKKGTRWFVAPSRNATTLDLSSSDSRDMDRIVDRAIEEFHSDEWAGGFLDFIRDIERTRDVRMDDLLESDPEKADSILEDVLRDEFAPANIDNSAATFDNASWLQWLSDRFDPDFVVTPDGAVALGTRGIFAVSPDTKNTHSPEIEPLDPNNPDIRFSRQSALMGSAYSTLDDAFRSHKTFNSWWHKTVGTQYHKATVDKDYERVFKLGQDYLGDVSRIALRPADLAPGILPKIENMKRAISGIVKGKKSAKDVDAIAEAVFVGTLNDKAYSVKELRYQGLSETQIAMYHQFRDATNASLEELAASEAWKQARIVMDPALKESIVGDPRGARTAIVDGLDALISAEQDVDRLELLDNIKGSVTAIYKQLDKMKSNGYAPLMRFGKYTVDVVELDPTTGEILKDHNGEEVRHYFSMFESEREANAMARQMRELYPGATVKRDTMSERNFEIFRGVSPESMELFAQAVGAEESEIFQKYLKLAINNRSAMKRLIRRKGIAGYSPDVTRVLAAFITSNARLASKNYHMGDMTKAVAAIPKGKGDVIDEANDLYKYLTNPQEEAAKLRGYLFMHYLGGSLASAVVNATQPLMMTAPYLTSLVSIPRAVAITAKATKLALSKTIDDSALADALHTAEQEGLVAPQEIHHLYAEAMRQMGGGYRWRSFLTLWGTPFALAEAFNRRHAFISAWLAAKETGKSPYSTAVKAVHETQGIYNRGNRADWARGPVGSVLMTFKQYSVAYVELFKRLPWKSRGVMLGILILMAGMQGLPGAEDLEDLIDTLLQAFGYAANSKKWLRDQALDILGEEVGNYVLHGTSVLPGMPIDVQQRLGMQNLLPATALFKRSNKDKSQAAWDMLGPAGGLVKSALDASDALMRGDEMRAAKSVLPKAFGNLVQAYDMGDTGVYKDTRGNRVLDVDAADVLSKAIGFMPAQIGARSRLLQGVRDDIAIYSSMRQEFAERIAKGVVDKDPAAVSEARADLIAWNRDNPEMPIQIKDADILKKVVAAKMTRDQRFIKLAPPAMRGTIAKEFSQ